MKYEKTSLKSGIKACYIETFDYELAQIASTLFEHDTPTDRSNSYQLELIKTKKNCKTYRLSRGNDVYYLKKFFEQSLFIKIRNIFRTTKAFRCYSISQKLSLANIPVAEPLMYLTYTKRIIEKESIFVTKKVDGISFQEFMIQNNSLSLKEEVLKKLFCLLGHLYKNGFKHGDPGLYNYFIDDNFLITFLDLDVIHKLPRMPVIVALNGLVKIDCLSGSFFGDKWPIYFKIFLDVFDQRINLDEAMCYIKKERERRIIKYKKRKRALMNINNLSSR